MSKNSKETDAGIYFEGEDGKWQHCSSNDPKQEVAFVFYIHRESQGRLEMVLGGFSGRATRLLARALGTRAQDFWPPQFEKHGIQIGAFIVQFEVPATKKDVDILRTDLVANSTVTPISAEAINRHLQRR